MIESHNGVIEMAKDEQKNGRSVVVKKLAEEVVTNGSAEVTQDAGHPQPALIPSITPMPFRAFRAEARNGPPSPSPQAMPTRTGQGR